GEEERDDPPHGDEREVVEEGRRGGQGEDAPSVEDPGGDRREADEGEVGEEEAGEADGEAELLLGPGDPQRLEGEECPAGERHPSERRDEEDGGPQREEPL